MAPLALLGSLVVLLASSPAFALQPLEGFLSHARQASTTDREAALLVVQREAETLAAQGQLLPTVSASGSYTRNQHETSMGLGAQTVVIQPYDQLAASVQLRVPLLDLAGWKRAQAAQSLARASRHFADSTALEVDRQVAQYYFQLVGTAALRRSLEATLAVAEQSASLTRSRREEGTATDLDVARAEVDVESARRSLADAALVDTLARRALTTLSGLVPEGEAPELTDDLHEEAPLSEWEQQAEATPSVKAAAERRLASQRLSGAARMALVPTASAAVTEQTSNSAGLVGHSTYATAMLSLSWQLGVPTFAQIRSQDAATAAARVQEEAALNAARDAVHEAWQRVRIGLTKGHAARSQAAAATLAAQAAQERYAAGAGTQLDLIQAQRDLASAEASRIQADADLGLARVQLRLAAGGL